MALNKKFETAEVVTGTAADETAQGLEPSFKLSEGNRADLELRGYTVSPFTGALLVGTGLNDVREVSTEEFQRVAKAAAKRETDKPNKGTRFPKG